MKKTLKKSRTVAVNTVQGPMEQPEDSFDLTPRERREVSGKWVIVSYCGQVDARSAGDDENEAWERFLDGTNAPKLRFVEDGFKAVKMP